MATVVKDAGDDPDVTNGAEIGAIARMKPADSGLDQQIRLLGGEGVGIVTKPGLPVEVGNPAINPVPQQMIRASIAEVLAEMDSTNQVVEVTLFIRDGGELAKKTLNERLGVIGGLSILGTTGIVRPVSASAWTDTIESSMKVAKAAGLDRVQLSTGRTSEKAVLSKTGLPEEAGIMMGDYLRYALEAAARHQFSGVVMATMWAKLVKAALAIPQTHVRHGDLDPVQTADLLFQLGLEKTKAEEFSQANTAREIYDRLMQENRIDIVHQVCLKAQHTAQTWSGLPADVYLVTSEEGIVHHVLH